ncbi:hypothetical protein [Deinococcus sp.]|uniref:hypothetical protein n=1 Tax=Deinococcus sp. TaxID=47478 RepID=UPI003B599165
MLTRLLPLALLTSAFALAQTSPLPCTLAVKLDFESYDALSQTDYNEANADESSFNYAECRAAQLGDELKNFPQLRARLEKLRGLYRQMRALEGELAYAMAEGGTVHTHAVPRSYPGLEATLGSLAALARSSLGGQMDKRYGASLSESRTAFEQRVKALKAWTPKQASSSFYEPRAFQQSVSEYAQTGAQIMTILGNRADVVTATGYLPLQSALFVDEYLREF